MRDSRRYSPSYNALRDAHDVAVYENTSAFEKTLVIGVPLVLIIVFGFGKIIGKW